MSIKSEKFPDEFEKLFKRCDSPDRDKKDVAFLIWCEYLENWEKCCQELKETLIAENEALKLTAEIFNIESELKSDKITEQAIEISALKESRSKN